jgi:serine/threonine-protein kinase
MTLAAGSRLGSYEILTVIGSGGMGEVYRGRDLQLHRDVALKILPDLFASDPERLARFGQEAQILASLNHPNIAQIYALEANGPTKALIMELVEGPTLADRIAEGPIPLEEALAIAKQIAEALEAAHERGVIHRDLKPANVKVRPDGSVKVLDFGLAKLAEAAPEPSGARLANSPTITSPALMTGVGVLLGTAAYMSPEQAAGKPVDKRSDIWAFGVVLLEMLTGHQVFEGETVSHVLASVLKDEPHWTALPANTPAPIRKLLRRCLEKPRRKRLADASDARLEIEDALTKPSVDASPAAVVPTAAPRRVAPVAFAALGGALVGVLAMWILMRPAPTPGRIERFVVPTPAAAPIFGATSPALAISPDGSRMVYRTARGASAESGALYLRDRGQLEPTFLRGTEGAADPVFSPDGEWIAFWSGGRTLKRVSVLGGPPQTICALDGAPRGASWGADNTIVFATTTTKGLRRVAAAGGESQVLTTVDETAGDTEHVLPEVLPGGRAVLFTAWSGAPERARIAVVSLADGRMTTLVRGGTHARFASSGHLVFDVGGTLRAVRFDPARLSITGTPVPVLEGVLTTEFGAAQYALSFSGTLVYVPDPVGSTTTGPVRRLAFVDRKGMAEPVKVPPGAYQLPRLSPDGKRIAFGSDDGTIWIYELAGGSAVRRLTLEGEGHNRFPVWSADGQRVTFQSDREKDLGIFWQRADGTGPAERLAKAKEETAYIPEAWSPDGAWLLYAATSKDGMAALWTFASKDGKAERFESVISPVSTGTLPGAVFSPDGRWVAYATGELPRLAVYVQPFPPTGIKFQISKNEDLSHHPVWSRNGKELFFISAQGLDVVPIATQPAFSFGEAVRLRGGFFVGGAPRLERPYDISPDGQRILAVFDATDAAQSGGPQVRQIQAVLNWTEELKARVPTK